MQGKGEEGGKRCVRMRADARLQLQNFVGRFIYRFVIVNCSSGGSVGMGRAGGGWIAGRGYEMGAG